jgi:glycosyltransferase involved in cell wall biosynthesis
VKRRLVFSVTNDLSYDQRMLRICNTLNSNGYDVLLVGRKLKHSPPFSAPFAHKRLRCFFTKGKMFYLEFNIRLFLFVIRQEFDIACAVDLDTILPMLFAAKRKKKKLGYDAHEYFQETPEVVGRKNIQRLWKRVGAYAIPKTDFRITVSKGIAQEFEELYGKDFQVVRNLPYLRKAEPCRSSGDFILYQGALNKGRGLEALIEASAKLPLPVKIAGEGDLSRKLRRMVKIRQLGHKVEFLGKLSPEHLAELTPKAFVGYNLLENIGLSYYYSLANKFFDYTMSGIPCLIPGFPEYQRIHDEYGIGLIAELNPESIIMIINDLYENEENYKAHCEQANKAAQDLNWENESRKLLEIFEGCF